MAFQRRRRLRGSVSRLLPLQTRSCGKQAFATREAAEATLRRIAGTTGREEYPRRAYECGDCGWIHLTKLDRWVTPALPAGGDES